MHYNTALSQSDIPEHFHVFANKRVTFDISDGDIFINHITLSLFYFLQIEFSILENDVKDQLG